jgi:acyl carrier protein
MDGTTSAFGDIRVVIEEIWRSVLDVADIPEDADFIDLGGDSISAMQIVGRIQRRFGIRLSPDCILEQPTLAAFASRVSQEMGHQAATSSGTGPHTDERC